MNQDQQRMNGITLGEILSLLCCPPCPSSIASKLAFSPPDPTYSFESVNDTNESSTTTTTTTVTSNNSTSINPNTSDQINPPPNGTTQGNINSNNTNNNNNNNNNVNKFLLKLDDRAEWQFSQKDLNNFEVFYAAGSRNKKIASMYVKATAEPKFTILFSHGNAADLGLMSSFYLGLGTKIDCNIFGYDYSGYGISSGKPSEKNLYSDIEIAWNELRRRYNVPANRVILYGQSIGTVPTVDLASKYDFGGVILHSPLTSGLRLAFPNTKRTWFFDAFPK